ncbi:MAG: hypothetical protein K2N38_00640 [Oscillospiraceae bacterium]|nr:hypothetical protein [Oscillospiraceae bacterium]
MITDELRALERNRFFYGKLLTAEDFIVEQNYFNTKMRLLNSLLFGSGVIAGLNVIKTDERSVAINSGIALDHAGREIIVPEPMIVKINELDGYDGFIRENADYTCAYLCIEYNETRTQPIHSIARSALDDENEGPEYNRITEGFSLYITAKAPEGNPCESEDRALVRKAVVSDVIDVSVVFPRVVRAGEEFVFETNIDKGNADNEIELEFDLKLEALTAADGSDTVHITYKSQTADLEKETVRTMLRSSLSFADKGIIRIENVKAICNKARLSAAAVYAETDIVADSSLAVINSLNSRNEKRRFGLYLARLELYVSPQYFILESVKNLPFSQIIPSVPNLRAFQMRSEFARAHRSESVEKAVQPSAQPLVNSGYIGVEIPEKAKKGMIFRSAEIPHGLGTGIVFINVGISDGSGIVFESSSVVNRDFSYGASVDKDTGTFSVSVRLNRDHEKDTLNFCWLASRLPEKTVCRKLEIYPSVHYAGRYETVQFTVSHPDGGIWRNGELEWSVTPDDGGLITQSGTFTAFDKAGFYEISVRCPAEPGLTASAFLVVK